MSKKKYFGTDGIRGKVGASSINPEFVLKLGWAIGKVLANDDTQKSHSSDGRTAGYGERKIVLIGKDTRVSGYMLESALEAGLSSAGVDIRLLGPMPTPAIAYLTRTLRASAGIVISASHNLFDDNGIKFFSGDGLKLGDEMEDAIERQLEETLAVVSSKKLGKAQRVNDASGRYIEFCKSTIPPSIRFNQLKIVVDCANGATYHIAPNVFRELGAEVISVSSNPDGFNINENCGSTDPNKLQRTVIAEQADLGIALDGDGDRVILVDNKGEVVDGDEILYIITKSRLQRGTLRGGVVGTVMSNLGLELALRSMGVSFSRAKVGDRYVLEQLQAHGWRLGGESSGHIICMDKSTTGDGIIAALQVLLAMHNLQSTLYELKQGMQKLPQVKINIATKNAAEVLKHQQVIKAMASIEEKLSHNGRVLLRASGTEAVTRVMVEGTDLHLIESFAQELAAIVTNVAEELGHPEEKIQAR